KIWEKGIELAIQSYEITGKFPKEEKFGLISQMNRCAVSVPSNIAEGTAKSSDKHFSIFLENALGSSFEWQTQLIIAHKIGYINIEDFKNYETKIKEIQRMINSFMDRIKS
ncbi:four helix bundle protein, partial [Nonlabens sp.]|uniref:four helix bundle protein n=1 Tax=Nonlabens sp. TaxID=1888209 RepID=UPI003F69D352